MILILIVRTEISENENSHSKYLYKYFLNFSYRTYLRRKTDIKVDIQIH